MIKNRTFSKNDFRSIVEVALAYVLALGIFTYGFGKIRQFTGSTDPHKFLVDFTGMELMWAFYRHSQPYVYLIGFFQILGAFLILFKRSRLAGCLLLTTILFNIILQDYFYGVYRGALLSALYYQAIILALIYFNKEQFIHLLQVLSKPYSDRQKKRSYERGILIILLLLSLRVFEYFLTMKWLA